MALRPSVGFLLFNSFRSSAVRAGLGAQGARDPWRSPPRHLPEPGRGDAVTPPPHPSPRFGSSQGQGQQHWAETALADPCGGAALSPGDPHPLTARVDLLLPARANPVAPSSTWIPQNSAVPEAAPRPRTWPMALSPPCRPSASRRALPQTARSGTHAGTGGQGDAGSVRGQPRAPPRGPRTFSAPSLEASW